jgi:putative DNA methylase
MGHHRHQRDLASGTKLTIRKKLIEVSIPLEAINAASAREKSIRHGHPSTLHLWWARRPLAVCRAVLFAQLVDDPSAWPDRFPTEEAQDIERRRLHRVIEAMVPWEASNNEIILNAARWEIARSVAWGLGEEPPTQGDTAAILAYLQTKAPPVYDPFSGGGSIPLEAQRLGLRAYGSDLNPVAVLIGKALVEIPPKFAGQPPVNPEAQAAIKAGGSWNGKGTQGLAEDVRYYGRWMRDEAERRIGHLYPKAKLPDGSEATVIAWLWARTVRSPDPAAKGAMVPLVTSFMVLAKESKKSWVEPVIDPQAQDGWRFEVRSGALSRDREAKLKQGTKAARATFACVLTGVTIGGAYVDAEAQAGRLSTRLMAVVVQAGRSRIYLDPSESQVRAAMTASSYLSANREHMKLPLQECRGTFGSNAQGRRYCFNTFADYFTDRQLTSLTGFSDIVSDVRQRSLLDAVAAGFASDGGPLADGNSGARAYADAVATYLAFAVSKASTRSCSLAIWESGMGRLAGAMGRQGVPMQWSFAETNPLAGAGGDIAGTAVSVAENLSNLGIGGVGSISNLAAQTNSFSTEAVVISTDPPYYDNVNYSDLSDFFYVWLRRSLTDVWPGLFRRLLTPKDEELIAETYRHGGKAAAEAFFMSGMSKAITSMRRAASDVAPLAIYYAFKQSEAGADGVASTGWSTFLQAIVDAGLVVDGTWPVRTEATSALKANINALASSVVLVCRKRSSDADVVARADFIRVLKLEMPTAIEAIRKAGVGPVDMQQSVIGPGMGVFSRHAKVLEDDDSAMSVRTALMLINRVWEEIENELDAAFDPETQVALAWYGSYGFDARPSGELIMLTTAKNTSDRALFQSGVFEDRKGKAALTARADLLADWTPATDKHLTVWECVQHTARVLGAADGGATAAARLVAQMDAKSTDARKLAYRLFEIATKKGWSTEALVYNELAEMWPKLEDAAAGVANAMPATPRQQSLFE